MNFQFNHFFSSFSLTSAVILVILKVSVIYGATLYILHGALWKNLPNGGRAKGSGGQSGPPKVEARCEISADKFERFPVQNL